MSAVAPRFTPIWITRVVAVLSAKEVKGLVPEQTRICCAVNEGQCLVEGKPPTCMRECADAPFGEPRFASASDDDAGVPPQMVNEVVRRVIDAGAKRAVRNT